VLDIKVIVKDINWDTIAREDKRSLSLVVIGYLFPILVSKMGELRYNTNLA